MALRETFASWDWRFGKTPKFTVQKDIELKSTDKESSFKLKMDVEKVNFELTTYLMCGNKIVFSFDRV